MTRPTKHKKSGKFTLRMAIPAHLREITQRRYGKSSEFFENLQTTKEAEAKRLAPPVIERFQSQLAAAQAEYENRPEHLTDRQIAALGGRYVAIRAEQDRDHTPPTSTNWANETSYLSDVQAWFEGSDEVTISFEEARSCVAEGLDAVLAEAALHIDDDSLRRLVACLVPLERQHLKDLAERNNSGRWRNTLAPSDFPTLDKPTSKATPTATGPTLDTLLERWALDRGYKMDAKPIARALYDRVRTIERLATFLGHRDASRVTKANAVAWKDDMQRRDLYASTIRNDLSEMSAIWKTAIANGLATENPFMGVSPPKAKKPKNPRGAFTNEEAARIIAASRKETGALRWLPIVLCMTGARVSEIAQSVKEDISLRDGVNVIRIHDEGEGRSVKNEDSRRTVPIHPALEAEGFLDYVAALPDGSPLFPDLTPDGIFGSRGDTAIRTVGRWFEKQGFKRRGITANHSWRHWFISSCRRVVMPPEVRSAITGHSAKLDESAGYGDGMGTMIQVMARYLATVKPPGEVVEDSGVPAVEVR